MKKSFISLVAAAAIAGGALAIATTSSAGTISTSGGTNVTMYGFIRTYTQWDKNAGVNGLVADKTVNHKATWSGLDLTQTRLGFKFNSGNGISGKLETDFSPGTLRIRHAYVIQSLGGGAWVLVGQSWGPAFTGSTFTNTLNWDVQPGELGPAIRGGQIALGNTFGFGGGSLEAVVAVGNLGGFVTGTAATDATWNLTTLSVTPATVAKSTVARITTPGLVGKLIAKIKTGFGTPVTVWGTLFGQSLKITNPTTLGTESSKTPYGFAAGAAIPISMVTLKTNFNYAKGLTGFVSVGMPGPDSYYTSGSTTKAATATAWNLEADVAATKNVGFALGYFTAKFKKAAVEAKGPGTVKKTTTVFAQVSFKTSKATKLALELDHLKTKYYDGTGYYNDKGNQEFVTYQYNF